MMVMMRPLHPAVGGPRHNPAVNLAGLAPTGRARHEEVAVRETPILTSAVVFALLGLSGATLGAAPAAAPPAVASLRCEYKVDPMGIDVAQPRLSWQLQSAERGVVQSAYQVQVTREGKTLWDTGRVASDRSVHVPYGGPALEASRRYGWRVRVWDGAGKASAWSAPASWEMGLLKPGDWTARWIQAAGDEPAKASQPRRCCAAPSR